MTPRSTPPAPTPEGETPTFEAALERLETIVEDLEGGSLSLEDSIRRYEEGVGLARRLTQTLEEAERRIERLVEREPGTPTTVPVDLEADVDPAGETRRRAAADAPDRGSRETPSPRRPPREPAPRDTPRDGGMEELPF